MFDSDYWITRFLFQRSLGLIYFLGFAAIVVQFVPLCGAKGLAPAAAIFKQASFWEAPSLFWLNHSDRCYLALGWLGLILSLLAVTGISDSFGLLASMLIWFSLWVIYLSFVNIGGTFYAFGWEALLLEAGFLAVFLGSSDTKVPVLIIWLLRWLLFRLMFGAGLIKIRGDGCWRDLTCMFYHYETQPLPNPLSWYFHHLPKFAHKGSVLFNHLVELVVPWGYFFPGIIAGVCGVFTIVFQALLIASGNFSWLNYLSIVLAVPCFNDAMLSFVPITPPPVLNDYKVHHTLVYGLAILVACLSIKPAVNLVSSRQLMNASFDPLRLVNTYGAFGSITKVRREIVIEGTDDPAADTTNWREYGFKAKPGDVERIPPLIAPYHLRLDWLMWFAAMSDRVHDRWFVTLIEKLLEGDAATLGLIRHNPFPDEPPASIRAILYEYRFTSPGERAETGAVWTRKKLGVYMPRVALTPSESAN